ncbi:predicted protein [Nematostella vectensis]|uniref:Tyr recombinase domain-containing protein n=1 Tax=Nematostella vectensis TaxID=45351 RepID=A7S0Y7_NEMVE|nr:predicted protein [Nematostella vectensis]|eukprot:XP_001634728.1 predicted protein [Nematostella vectensis]
MDKLRSYSDVDVVNFDKMGSCWYKNEPLGKNSISKLMPKISQKAGLSKVYTAHCVRASTITSLHQAGVDAKQICGITKHKNEQSLSSYIKDSSSSQKRACSGILSRPFASSEIIEMENSNDCKLGSLSREGKFFILERKKYFYTGCHAKLSLFQLHNKF